MSSDISVAVLTDATKCGDREVLYKHTNAMLASTPYSSYTSHMAGCCVTWHHGVAVEWRFLLSGVTLGAVATQANPAPRWLTDKSWTQILNLAALPAFQVRSLRCTESCLQHALSCTA